MQPKTKEAVFNGINVAIERFGSVGFAASALGIEPLRFQGVVDGKLPVPQQWIEAFIAYGHGNVGAAGFKELRNKVVANIANLSKTVSPPIRSTTTKLSHALVADKTYRLIRLHGELRLLPPDKAMPDGALAVYDVNNRKVYVDGSLRACHLSIKICEDKYLKPIKKPRKLQTNFD